jgi:hypothetical protein
MYREVAGISRSSESGALRPDGFQQKTHRCVGGGFGVVIVYFLPARRRYPAWNARNRGLNRADGEDEYKHRENDYKAALRFTVNANFRCVRYENPTLAAAPAIAIRRFDCAPGLQFRRLIPRRRRHARHISSAQSMDW